MILWFRCQAYSNLLEFSGRMIDQRLCQRQCFFCRNVFVIIFGASGPGVRSIHNIAQWDIDFSCVGIVKESESCNQSTVTLTSRGQRFKFRRRKPSFWHAELTILAMWAENVRESESSIPR